METGLVWVEMPRDFQQVTFYIYDDMNIKTKSYKTLIQSQQVPELNQTQNNPNGNKTLTI